MDYLDDLVEQETDLIRGRMVYEAVETALQFHQGIAHATDNPFLYDASTRINTCALRIWHDTAIAEQSPGQEHAHIVDALRRRHPRDAVAAVQQHATNAHQRCIHAISRLETPAGATGEVARTRSPADPVTSIRVPGWVDVSSSSGL